MDAPGNSSVLFTRKPPLLQCHGSFYYNNGAIDPDNDSINYEFITPEEGTDCSPANLLYKPGYSLANPIDSIGSFIFNTITGDESFTADSIGPYAFAIRVNEYRKYQTPAGHVWKKIGSVMRDHDILIAGCVASPPVFKLDTTTIVNASYAGSILSGCTVTPISFCFDIKVPPVFSSLSISDNHASFPVSIMPNVTYTNNYTDSVRGCFSWTPGPNDTGLFTLNITAYDTTLCYLFHAANTRQYYYYTIPIYIHATTHIFKNTIICPGDTVHLLAVGGGGFIWSVLPGGSGISSLSCTNCTNPIAAPGTTTDYAVFAANNFNCSKRDTVTISVVPPRSNRRIDTSLCTGQSITLALPITTPTAGIITAVRWSPFTYLSSPTARNPICTPTSSTRYFATITYSGKTACQSVDTINVKVLDYIKLTIKDTTVCKGSTVHINAIGDPSFTYTWVPVTGVSNPNILTPDIAADTTLTYTVHTSHAACRDTTASFTLTVLPAPQVFAGNDTSICAGSHIMMKATTNPPLTYTYDWQPASAVQYPAVLQTVFIADSTTQLIIRATTNIGCSSTDTVWVYVKPAPVFDLGKDTLVCRLPQIQINAPGQDVQYLWNNGDTTCCITAGANGSYILTETNSYACSYTDTMQVHFSSCINCIAVPNAFSPNGDGIDDVFKPILLCPLKEYHLKIFNRWGQEIFHSDNVTQGWDGNYKGQLSAGKVGNNVFVYYIELTEDKPGAQKTLLKGNITVVAN